MCIRDRNCTLCYPGSSKPYLQSNSCVSSCLGMNYFVLPATNVCTLCNTNCLTCSVAATNCTSCLSTSYLSATNSCIACNSNCLTCTGSATNCTACNTSSAYHLKDSTSGTSTVCVNDTNCNSTTRPTYIDDASESCKNCSSTCKKCSVTPTNCILCPTGQYVEDNTNLSLIHI
eukprot:TRINITY_DN5136_c0_g2_i1.p2 TRINITY_DN5136_c0_g2~~TRINITY_DN5136_c0_g2_i1.p2  ORF type:complete len:174 (+),score=7.27 TRINITY_DN5136_c0_g2_i1:64-585(+)